MWTRIENERDFFLSSEKKKLEWEIFHLAKEKNKWSENEWRARELKKNGNMLNQHQLIDNLPNICKHWIKMNQKIELWQKKTNF